MLTTAAPATRPAVQPGHFFSTEPADTPGLDALNAHLGAHLDGAVEHYANDLPIPGRRGVWAVNAYRQAEHWVFVTYGLSELFDKTPGSDEAVSGFGYELTMRVPEDRPVAAPPAWVATFLAALAGVAFTGAATLNVGQRADWGGSITGDPADGLTALAITTDPVLPAAVTEHGRVEFRTVVGVTAPELALMRRTSTDEVLDTLRTGWGGPLLLTAPQWVAGVQAA